MKQVTSTRDLAGADSREDDEAAKLELTYSTMSGIHRVRPTLGRLVVCIIQVPSLSYRRRSWFVSCSRELLLDPVSM